MSRKSIIDNEATLNKSRKKRTITGNIFGVHIWYCRCPFFIIVILHGFGVLDAPYFVVRDISYENNIAIFIYVYLHISSRWLVLQNMPWKLQSVGS
jgi:hypothetical protein